MLTSYLSPIFLIEKTPHQFFSSLSYFDLFSPSRYLYFLSFTFFLTLLASNFLSTEHTSSLCVVIISILIIPLPVVSTSATHLPKLIFFGQLVSSRFSNLFSVIGKTYLNLLIVPAGNKGLQWGRVVNLLGIFDNNLPSEYRDIVKGVFGFRL